MAGSGIWLSTGTAIYRATELPDMEGSAQVLLQRCLRTMRAEGEQLGRHRFAEMCIRDRDLFLIVLLYHSLCLSFRQSAFNRAFIEVRCV